MAYMHYKKNPPYKSGETKMVCDRSGFIISSDDMVFDGNVEGCVVHKDFYDEYDLNRLPIRVRNETIPYPIRPEIDSSPEFCYTVQDALGNVIGVNCGPNVQYNRTDATATQITTYRPVLGDYTFFINPFSISGTVVGQVQATDPNNIVLSYSLSPDSNFNNSFAINSSTGVITVNNTSSLPASTFPFVIQVTATQTTGVSRLSTVGNVTINNLQLYNWDGLIQGFGPNMWLKMNETSGLTLSDSSFNSNNFTLHGPPEVFLYNHTNMFNGFDTGSIYENTAGWNCQTTTNLSDYFYTTRLSGIISAKFVNATAGADRVLIASWGTAHSFQLYYADPTTLGLRLAGPSSPGGTDATITAPIGDTSVVKLIAFSYDGVNQTVKLYLNGVALTTTVSGTIPTTLNTALSATPLTIGIDGSSSEQFFGDLSNAALFAAVLSSGQMLQLYNAAHI